MIFKPILIILLIILKDNLHLIMFMMINVNKLIYIIQLLDYQYVQLCKVIMQQYLHMDKQVQVKPIQCKVLNIIFMIIKEVSYLARYKIYLNIYKDVKINKLNLWLELPIYKYIIKLLVIF
jgi:hypothetical protein